MDLHNWRKIKLRMSELRVTKLLGEPTQRGTIGGNIVLIYKGYGKTASITFDQFGAVNGWKEPT